MKLDFVPIDETGFQTLLSWSVDPILRRWFSPPTQRWLEYVQTEPGVYAWMVYDKDLPVGHIQVDIEENGTCYLGFLVNPELRRQGYGKQMLVDLLSRPEVGQAHRIIGEVELENIAGMSCLLSAGFVQAHSQPSEEGFLQFVIHFNR